jgi:DNA polymerase elongation subunit (family B)
MPNILVLDIETAPNLAYVWRFWQENISAKQVLKACTILCWSAKWVGADEIFYSDGRGATSKIPNAKHEKKLLKELIPLLETADMVVGHNLSKFDMPKIRGRCLAHSLPIPSPYKEIDTYKIASKEFGFESNSLEYLASILLDEQKGSHKAFPGFELWSNCLLGNPDAWEEMKEYNIVDIKVTEALYLKIRPYATAHPNVGVYQESGDIACPKCSSGNSNKRGYAYTATGKYQRYQCNNCGGWHRSRFTEYPKSKRDCLTVNTIS